MLSPSKALWTAAADALNASGIVVWPLKVNVNVPPDGTLAKAAFQLHELRLSDGKSLRHVAIDVPAPGPVFTPSRQKRSRETTLALLKAGAEMLRTHSLTELSIEALCREVGATVGAFYSRFDSKEAYFNVLIELAARDGGRGLSKIPPGTKFKDADLAALLGHRMC